MCGARATEHKSAGRVVILGGSGFLGQGLARWLIAAGDEAVVISRREPAVATRWVAWDGEQLEREAVKELDGAIAVVNVVGRSVDCRKWSDRRDEILRSRLNSVIAIGDALARCDRRPDVWVQAASAHIYGDPPEVCCDERACPGEGFAPFVCTRWEAAYERMRPPGVRRVILRMSFVLGRGGGAMRRLEKLTRWGLGGHTGSGRHWMSWVHQRDVNRAFERAIRCREMIGIYNLTSPEPVRNAAFMRELRRAYRRPWSPPVPRPLVHIGAWCMDTDPDLALYGRRCVPGRLTQEGFTFDYPELPSALKDVVSAPAVR